jgi:hypothetical protein
MARPTAVTKLQMAAHAINIALNDYKWVQRMDKHHG